MQPRSIHPTDVKNINLEINKIALIKGDAAIAAKLRYVPMSTHSIVAICELPSIKKYRYRWDLLILLFTSHHRLGESIYIDPEKREFTRTLFTGIVWWALIQNKFSVAAILLEFTPVDTIDSAFTLLSTLPGKPHSVTLLTVFLNFLRLQNA